MGRCALAGDYAGLERVLREEGFVKPGAAIEIDPIRRRIEPIVAQIDGHDFHFSRAMLQEDVARALDPANISLVNARAMKAPADRPEYAMFGRVLGGVVGICAQLDARGPFLGLAEQWIPGFADSHEAAG
ncbi:hypothetical protein [Nocardia inohanensis]|uniref:hypothetical protein n=1 Tax=Nocardia inohanensis TaxID=209246 RepID=UPI0008317539